MAKDPAFLFYSQDFIVGTTFFNYEQRGKYIMLLCLQHQYGIISEKMMFEVCSNDDHKIIEKFIKTEDGYYNERLKSEVEKRANFAQSRSKNRANKKPSLSEVIAYFEESGHKNEADRFYNYYESKGWMVGKNPMKQWKSAVANWIKNKQLYDIKTNPEVLKKIVIDKSEVLSGK